MQPTTGQVNPTTRARPLGSCVLARMDKKNQRRPAIITTLMYTNKAKDQKLVTMYAQYTMEAKIIVKR
jgi:predicted deacetylase